jgi:hypothetical protein
MKSTAPQKIYNDKPIISRTARSARYAQRYFFICAFIFSLNGAGNAAAEFQEDQFQSAERLIERIGNLQLVKIFIG